jgi:hypothetical protein
VSEAALMMRWGSGHPLQVLMFEPLFEEANRTRRLIASVARVLDADGIGLSICPLPGAGESLVDIATVSFADWRSAAAKIIAEFAPTVVASLRGGALIDDAGPAKGWWRFSPETGARIVRDLRRTQMAGESGLYAGHHLSDSFLAELEAATPTPVSPLRIARLESDAATSDVTLPGSPLWRRAEPGEDPVLAAAMAEDLADWTRTCAAR